MTAPEAPANGPGGAGDDQLPPYTPPQDGFWGTQPWESNVPLGQGPPPYEPLPPVLAELGPEYHDLQTQRYDNQTLAHEAHAWQQQAPARDPRQALDSTQETLAQAAGQDPTHIPIEQLLADPADKAAIERNLLDLDRPPPFGPPPPHQEFESSSQRLGSTHGLEHQQHTSDHLRQQNRSHAQAQYHRQQAQEMRDPQHWSQYHDDQARLIDQQALEHRDRSAIYKAAGHTGDADLSQYRQQNLEAQAQQHRDQAQKLREWDQWETFKRVNRPQPVADPDALDTPGRTRSWGHRNRGHPANPPPAATPPPQHSVAQLSHDDATQTAQTLRDYAHHHETQTNDHQETVDTSRQLAASHTDTAGEHQLRSRNDRNWRDWHAQEAAQHDLERERDQRRAQQLHQQAQTQPERAQHLQQIAQRHENYAGRHQQEAANHRRQAPELSRSANSHDEYTAYHQQEARRVMERADRLEQQIPQLQERAQQDWELAAQYDLASHRRPDPATDPTGQGVPAGLSTPGNSSTIVHDYHAISEATNNLRRVVSQLELGSHEIDHIQNSSTTQGQTATAHRQRVTQLRNMRRRLSDAGTRLLDALDLATTESQETDTNLARQFPTHP